MTSVLAEFVSQQDGDALGFIDIVQSIALGLARERRPKRLYVVRIDSWFGPKWLKFAGKVVNGVMGIWLKVLRVPPFVPNRVISERLFAAPAYEETKMTSPLHLRLRSAFAMERKIADIDSEAIFVWFSSESETHGRGAVMAYLPIENNEAAFYAGFAKQDGSWLPSMLRYISRSEVEGLQQLGRA